MASNNKSNNLEEKKKKKNNNTKKNEVGEAKKTPVKKPPQKSPIAKTPNQDKDKKKKKKKTTTTGNGRESPEVTVISPSSCDSQSQDIQPPRSQPNNHTSKSSKPDKNNKRKQNNDEDEGDGTMCKFPMARIKRIIKSEDPTLQLPQDVVFLVNKATEKFIEQFCEEAYDCSVQDRKKALAYKHLSSVVSKSKRFDFLSDYVPVKLKAEAALEQRKLVENGET